MIWTRADIRRHVQQVIAERDEALRRERDDLKAQLAAVRAACWPLARFLEYELGISDQGDHAGISWADNTRLGELSEAAYLALLAASPSAWEETQ